MLIHHVFLEHCFRDKSSAANSTRIRHESDLSVVHGQMLSQPELLAVHFGTKVTYVSRSALQMHPLDVLVTRSLVEENFVTVFALEHAIPLEMIGMLDKAIVRRKLGSAIRTHEIVVDTNAICGCIFRRLFISILDHLRGALTGAALTSRSQHVFFQV